MSTNPAFREARQGGQSASQGARGPGNVVTLPSKTLEELREKDPCRFILEKIKPQLQLAVPSALNVERVIRVALTEFRNNTKLADAALKNPTSFNSALLRATTLGFEIGNGLGHAYLVPFWNRKTSRHDISLIIGYRGMIDLARRSNQIESISARAVYEGDEFEVIYGLDEKLHHKPNIFTEKDASKLVAVYAVAKLKGGGAQFEVLNMHQIEAIRMASPGGGAGPWVDNFVEMAKKSVVRALFKLLPVSIEIKTAKSEQMFSLDSLSSEANTFDVDGEGNVIIGHGAADEPPVGSTDSAPTDSHSTDIPTQNQGNQYSPKLTQALNAIEKVLDIDSLNTIVGNVQDEVSDEELDVLTSAYRAAQRRINANSAF